MMIKEQTICHVSVGARCPRPRVDAADPYGNPVLCRAEPACPVRLRRG